MAVSEDDFVMFFRQFLQQLQTTLQKLSQPKLAFNLLYFLRKPFKYSRISQAQLIIIEQLLCLPNRFQFNRYPMNMAQPLSILLNDPQTVKETHKTLFTQLESNFTQLESNQKQDIKPISNQNSDILVQVLTDSRKSNFQDLNVYQLLDKCDQFITQHSIINPKPLRKSSVNSLDFSFHTQKSTTCSECKYHLLKELQWIKEKLKLEQRIQFLQDQIQQDTQFTELYNQKLSPNQLLNQPPNPKSLLKLIPQTISFNIKNQQDSISSSQSPSPKSTSLIQSDSQNQINSQKELLLQSIKTVNNKLTQSQTENKYLKIQNRSLLKKKSEIETMKKQIQKTKSQRDLFKKKLITLAEKQTQLKQKSKDAVNCKVNTAGLKERGLEVKKRNQALFQLSLTDASSMRKPESRKNEQSGKIKKLQRINFTSSLKGI